MSYDLEKEYQPDELIGNIYEEAHSEKEVSCPYFLQLEAQDTQYSQETLIGQGAIKDVYRYYDHRTRRPVALARPKEHLGKDFFDVFIHEAWLTSSLSHPNIIKIHDLFIENGRPYFTMDLKGNTTLEDVVLRGDSQRNLLEAFSKVCDAISYAHEKEILHLDLKPQNIQCDKFGEVLVCDWGLGKLMKESADEDELYGNYLYDVNFQTLYGEVKGSPGYMAPEQVNPELSTDTRSDIYALGCVLHFILTGEAPYTGTVEEVLKATEEGHVQSPSASYPDRSIPKSLEAVMMKALQKDPAMRYQHVQELQEEVTRYLQGLSTAAERPSLFRKATLYAKRHKVRVIISALSLLTISLLSLIYQRNSQKLESKAETLTTEIVQLGDEYEGLELSHNKKKEELVLLSIILSYKLADPFYQRNPHKLKEETDFFLDDPENLNQERANTQIILYEVNCIKLNFQEALKLNVPPTSRNLLAIKELASAFPDYNFNAERRPTIEQLCAVFQKMQELEIRDPRLVSSILKYDWHTRAHSEPYVPVITSLLPFFNHSTTLETSFNQEASQCTIKSKRGLNLIHSRTSTNILSFLRVDTLHLDVRHSVDLTGLHGSHIKHLDLSKVATSEFSQPIKISGLETITIREKQLPDGFFKNGIKSDTPYKIIRIPE